uniref:Uncharacterized protein n=1 Tax=Arundo donax TaxID=35708 RepID=A0A0A9HQ00_ARUDO
MRKSSCCYSAIPLPAGPSSHDARASDASPGLMRTGEAFPQCTVAPFQPH